MARTLLIAVCLAAASTGSETTAADRFAADQEWRYSVIDRYARQATQRRLSYDQWVQTCRQIRAEIERAGKWQKGWPLPKRIRDIGFNDWEIGWLEIFFLDSGYTNPTRDMKAPESLFVHHRFHSPADALRAGYHTRQVTSYRQENDKRLKNFVTNVRGRADVQGVRRVRAYYAMWDYLTANESRGIIARPFFGDFTKGEQPRIGLYNDSHKTVRGEYTVRAMDGERLVGEGAGDVEIPPYTERLVDVRVHSGYSFFQWHVELDFVPAGYTRRPISKTEVTAFHKTGAEFARLSKQPDPELDFADAVLWAGVERAWEADDLEMYARAVRDAGGRLYRFCGQQPEVREYVRKHLEAIEKPDTAPIPELPTKETMLVMEYFPSRSSLVQSSLQENTRLDPDALDATKSRLSDPALARLAVVTGFPSEKKIVKMTVRLEDGYLILGNADHSVVVSGRVTLYDGQVNLGTYSLDGTLWYNEHRLPFVAAERLVTFYQDKPSYHIELKLHSHSPAPRGLEPNGIYLVPSRKRWAPTPLTYQSNY